MYYYELGMYMMLEVLLLLMKCRQDLLVWVTISGPFKSMVRG